MVSERSTVSKKPSSPVLVLKAQTASEEGEIPTYCFIIAVLRSLESLIFSDKSSKSSLT